ncbi:MAG: hypothetical protein JNL38_15875 [Myxococcales bacterium]|nr:hypothetical protein [Myxococcales bacterium]
MPEDHRARGPRAAAVALLSLALASAACLTRPVTQQDPTTKVNFTTTAKQQTVDKIDILFAIDNSASMGDKQSILKTAVPDLVRGLIRPACVDADGKPTGAVADPGKPAGAQCPGGSEPEFKPVVDMHVGIVSSSLGGMGGRLDGCASGAEHQNDKARLLDRTKQGRSSKVEAGNYLAWFPNVPANDGKPAPAKGIADEAQFIDAIGELVVGVDQKGCGLEAQLESMYHFLVQPDPWDAVALTPKGESTVAVYAGLDEAILAQRKAFLRPDSLVAVIMVTDEDDSSADPLSLSGTGWVFMDPVFPKSSQPRKGSTKEAPATTAARGTQACATNPNSPDCTSCVFKPSDPACQENGGFYAADDDDMGVRFHRMKRRFGVDPQYPLSRYIDGLKSRRVPDRNAEHATSGNGAYVGTKSCTNPLFAKDLPGSAAEAIQRTPARSAEGKTLTDEQRLAAGLCSLPAGPRTPDLVYFAVLGGAPANLLFDGAYGDAPKAKTKIDFRALVGNDPLAYDYSGVDPHMDQSTQPRASLPGPGPLGDNGADVVHGREWNTGKADLQYACTFPLAAPLGAPRDCSLAENARSCDCDGDPGKAPPLCSTNLGGKEQIRAKAYPTIRQYTVAKGLGEQGIVASLCPLVDGKGKLFPDKNVDGSPSPFFGYRPAVASIIERLKSSLAPCLPRPLTREPDGRVSCLVLEVLPTPGPQSACDRPDLGLEQPDPAVLSRFREDKQRELGDPGRGAPNLASYPVCQVVQIVKPAGATCAKDAAAGWCYVTSQETTSRCAQAIVFSAPGSPPAGASVSLQCIEQSGAGTGSRQP